MTTIYAILENEQVRHIGKTQKSDLNEKLDQYIIESTSNPQKFEWLNNMIKRGKKPEIKAIFTFQDHESEYYESLFISDYKYFSSVKFSNQDFIQ